MNIETANRLYRFRKKHHLSQEELAEKIGVSRQAISKWERAEASPDTDNLILLAKVYGVTLDELLTGGSEKEQEGPEGKDPKHEKAKETEKTEEPEAEKAESGRGEAYSRVSFQNGIHVVSDNGDKVHVGWDGIHVHDKNGDKVSIDKNGIFVEENGRQKVFTDEDGHIFKSEDVIWEEQHKEKNVWYRFPYPLLVLIGFLTWGFLGGWHISWILFLTIPLYYSLVDAIYKRKPSHFAYPVLMAFLYLWIGMQADIWHPTWILFVTIPLYYCICDIFKKGRN